MRSDSIIIADTKAKPEKPENCKAQLIDLPLTATAKELGTALMKNMVAVGATCALMNLNTQTFEDLIRNMFYEKRRQSCRYEYNCIVSRIPIDARAIRSNSRRF